MDEKTRQRIWLGVVVALGLVVAVQYLNTRDLRSEVARLRISPEELQLRIDQRAQKVVADAVRERRQDMIAAGQWLHAFYQSEEGLKRKEGLWIDGHPDFEGIGAWVFDVYLRARLTGADDGAARQKVMDAIRQTEEWRRKHPGSR
ncbi:MAG: hypothetical protein A3G25_18990 [Betaproteobacteria bacterium RIFCSPLOWO2_12_FULL_63_13]|nr:MAG: hypothetical protein A3G25_18990 [Betaproteobacteria bacterium RIFCSPLOWO2_12_FULL_63_13]